MDLQNILKCFVFTFSFVMFCYQLNIATLNLMNPGIVDINQERDITVDDMPLITVCPTNQIKMEMNAKIGFSSFEESQTMEGLEFISEEELQTTSTEKSTRMEELGYLNLNDFLLGHNDKCKGKFVYIFYACVSFGAHMDLTFDELKGQVFDMGKVGQLLEGNSKDYSLVFIPGYGICKEASLLNYTQEIELYHHNPDDARVMITDRNYRSFFMPDVSSHTGSKIFMKSETAHYINVKIQERNTCTNEEKQMSEKDFQKCVDDKIQNELEQNNISCVPPWLSNNKQCSQTYPDVQNFYGNFIKDFIKNYRDMVLIGSNIRFEEECRQSCKETIYVVNEKGSMKSPYSEAFLSFNQKVLVTERVPNYDMFKYIIDVGSSLGLWLGLSVLGLHDLVIWAVQFVNNTFIIKKIRSAVTK